MPRTDPALPAVRTTAEAVAAGMTRHQVSRRVRRERWRRLRPGVFCTAEKWEGSDLTSQHVLAAVAALKTTPAQYVLSHASAAAVHGLPLPLGGSEVWMTRRPPAPTRYPAEMRLLVAGLEPVDLSPRLGGRLTALERTVGDCLRHLPEADAVAVADAAVRSRPDLDVVEAFERARQWPLVERARLLVPLVDGRRESPLESASAVRMHRTGVPTPELQASFYDGSQFIGRGDFWWPEFGVVGEADGWDKYAAGTALKREKLREDALRAEELVVVRWGYADLQEPGWSEWLMARLRTGRPERVTARVVLAPPLRLRPPR